MGGGEIETLFNKLRVTSLTVQLLKIETSFAVEKLITVILETVDLFRRMRILT